jgi:hypothetical protein
MILTRLLITSVTLSLPGWAASAPSTEPNLQAALHLLYDSKFEASRQSLSSYSASHPEDPLAYALLAGSYLFSELDRVGAMKGDFMSDDRNISQAKAVTPDPAVRTGLNAAIDATRSRAAVILKANPNDSNALLAMCIATGIERDYSAMVEHRLRESYDYIKESQGYATQLLNIDPTAYDAYVTKGFTEYLLASLPFYLRWFMKIDGISIGKAQGLEDLRVAANSGHYMKPFAQLLLAMFCLREKREKETEQLLSRLTIEYPDNPTFRTELAQLEAQHRHAN